MSPRKAATRTTDKVVQRCPYCRDRGPKQLVEGPKRLNGSYLIAVLLMAPFTCLLSLLLLPRCWQRTLEAYCDQCERSFAYD